MNLDFNDTKFDKINEKSRITAFRVDDFAKIMRLDEISSTNMLESMSLQENCDMAFKAGQGAGASGQFFFFTHDNKFLIKTLTAAEKKLMLKILSSYVDHISRSGNRSLLARIYGVFTIKTSHFPDLDFVIMQNTVKLFNKANSKLTFDLKGSKTKRWVKVSASDIHSKVLKDMNFLHENELSKLVNLTED